MKVSFVMFLAFAHIAFFVGCGKTEKTDISHPSQVAGNHVLSNTVDMVHATEVACTDAVVRTVAELEADFASISNYIYCNSSGARGAGMRMRDKLMTLPPELGERYARKMLKIAFSFPVDHLMQHQGTRSLRAMWDTGGWAWWQGADQVFYCEKLILKFTRYREAIKHARNEGNDWHTRQFITFVSEELNAESEFYEKQLAYRTSTQISPQDYALYVREVPDEQYAIIKAKFEKFLGRPIRTYEEIRCKQSERVVRRKMEEERRRGGPDVQVDTEGL